MTLASRWKRRKTKIRTRCILAGWAVRRERRNSALTNVAKLLARRLRLDGNAPANQKIQHSFRFQLFRQSVPRIPLSKVSDIVRTTVCFRIPSQSRARLGRTGVLVRNAVGCANLVAAPGARARVLQNQSRSQQHRLFGAPLRIRLWNGFDQGHPRTHYVRTWGLDEQGRQGSSSERIP